MKEPEPPHLRERDADALGELVSAHPAASGMHKLNIAIATAFTVLPGLAAAFFLLSYFTGPPKNQNWIGTAICGGLALLPGIGLLFLLLKLGWKLFLYENGLVYARGRNRVILWADVKSMFEEQDIVAGMRADARLKFTLLNGSWAIIDSSYKNFPEFTAGVGASVTRAVVARVSAALKKGEAVPFGKLKVTRTGLTFEDEELKWGEVGQVAVEDYGAGYALCVYPKLKKPLAKGKAEPWYSRAVTEFPNLYAFLELAGKVTKVSLPEPPPPKGVKGKKSRPPAEEEDEE